MATFDSMIPAKSYDDLVSVFHEAEKPNGPNLIGTEMEKPGVLSDGRPIQYSFEISKIFEVLASKSSWTRIREQDDRPVIALERTLSNGLTASITLEPGSQLELSGAPLANMHETDAELRAHMQELGDVSKELGIDWLGIGFHPYSKREDFEWVPKLRYAIMRSYLPKRGQLAQDMMLRTSTVQANFDFASEADAMRKMAVSLRISPILTGLFANSPFYEGKPFGGVSYRSKVWLEVDPDRSGLLPTMWKKGASYRDYVEWALDVPMFMFKRGDKVFHNTGQRFREFYESGFEGEHATMGDWQTHLNTLFPEIRLKRTLEVRGADSQNLTFATALPAIWTGILYDDQALEACGRLCLAWTYDEVNALRDIVWKDGPRTMFKGRTVAAWGKELLGIALGGLSRRNFLKDGRDEGVYLEPLQRLLEQSKCPADVLLENTAGKTFSSGTAPEWNRLLAV